MKTFKKETCKFLFQFNNNLSFARSELDNLVQFYERTGNKEKLNELFIIKKDLKQ